MQVSVSVNNPNHPDVLQICVVGHVTNIDERPRRVGYCGTRPTDPVSFLTPTECKLTDDEKQEVEQRVIELLSSGANNEFTDNSSE